MQNFNTKKKHFNATIYMTASHYSTQLLIITKKSRDHQSNSEATGFLTYITKTKQ